MILSPTTPLNLLDKKQPFLRAGSSSSSSSSRSPNSLGTAQTTPPKSSSLVEEDEVNPLFKLGQRIQNGQQPDVEVRGDGVVVQRSAPEPISLIHPSTWRSHSSENKVDWLHPKNGSGVELGLGTVDANGEEDKVTDFQDHPFESSKRDELRMKAHQAKQDWRGKGGDNDRLRVVDPTVEDQLSRVSSRDSGGMTTETDGEVWEQANESHSRGDTTNGYSTAASFFSTQSLEGSSTESLSAPPSQPALAHQHLLTTVPLSTPPALSTVTKSYLSESPEKGSSYFTDSPMKESPYLNGAENPPTRSAVDDENRAPVINTPGYAHPNSRIPPASTSSPASSSLTRMAPIGALIPLHASSSSRSPRLRNSHELPPSPTPLMKRSNTTGSSALTSSTSTFSRLSPSPTSANRAQLHPSPHRSQSYMAYSPHSPLQEDVEMDEIDSSIAAQAEIIRKERQTKRLAKELEDQQNLGVGVSGPGPGAGLRRKSTRMGSGDQADKVGAGVLVGNLIGQDHQNWVLMYNMLTGIRIGVSRCQAKIKRPLTDADYTARHKFSFDIVGNELTPSTKYDFKFKDYAPWVFRELREYFYLDPSDYLVSLTAKYILSELGSPGKSGSFFYFSRDYRFIIKTIRHSEHKFLRSILKEYHQYIKENPHTLLSRFYGLHRVKLPRGKKIHFVIMNNLFPPHRDIHETYDLKGSAIGRITPEEKAKADPRAILKDLNWVGRGRMLALGPEKKALFEEQLRRDTELMQKLGIMDYSLLTGIHNVVRGNVDGLRDGMLTVFQPDSVKIPRRRKPTQVKRDADAAAVRRAVQRSDPQALSDNNKLPDQDLSERRLFLFYQDEGGIRATGEENEDLGVIYYLGIIDILTPYGILKKLEHFFKGLRHDRHMISPVPPLEYGNRFQAFIKSILVGNDVSKRPRMYETDPKPGRAKEESGKIKEE